MTRNDRIETPVAVSGVIIRAALVAAVCLGAAVLVPVIGWSIAAVVCGLLAAAYPASQAGWGAVACFVVGMLIAGPDLGRSMLAVLLVQVILQLGALALVVPLRARVVLAALRPSAVRLVVGQAIAQPATFLVVQATSVAAPVMPWLALVGGGAVLGMSILLLILLRDASKAPSGR
ncbi:hypothetical protein ACI3KS_04775 [Microbacterium sp. ZW T5_45]|uniref:hypothetical protein n=1 Tax=Microbacterium sp. ZW T5_45 TaxID=3378080 RepID=UPI003851F8CA